MQEKTFGCFKYTLSEKRHCISSSPTDFFISKKVVKCFSVWLYIYIYIFFFFHILLLSPFSHCAAAPQSLDVGKFAHVFLFIWFLFIFFFFLLLFGFLLCDLGSRIRVRSKLPSCAWLDQWKLACGMWQVACGMTTTWMWSWSCSAFVIARVAFWPDIAG